MQYTYDTLFASCQNYCVDNSTNSTVQSYATEFPNIVQLAEMRIIKDGGWSIFDTTTTGTLTIGSQVVTKPSDYIAMQDFFIFVSNQRQYLQLRSKSWQDDYWRDSTQTDVPAYFADNTTTAWQIAPTPDQAYSYQVNYIARPLSMSPTNQNTWIGDKLGEVLLYATLVQSMPYFREDVVSEQGLTQLWEKAYEIGMKQAQIELAPQISAKDNTLFKLTNMGG